jgi:hypothetical protein
LLRCFLKIAKLIVSGGAEHDHTVPESQLGMGDRVTFTRYHQVLLEAESPTEPLDSGPCVTIAESGVFFGAMGDFSLDVDIYGSF